MAGPSQPRGRRREPERLPPHFIGRDEQDPHCLHYPAPAKIVLNLPMLAATSIADEILDLKKERRAILLAHHYQESEIQELADVVGDSLELSRKARNFEGDVIAFAGVWFMAEVAKAITSPSKLRALRE